LLIASLVGSIYTLVVFFPSLQFMGKFIIKFSVSILMIVLAFNPEKLKIFLRQLSTFYLTSFVFAGTVIGIFYILNNRFIVSKFSFKNSSELYKFLTIGIGLGIILIRNILKNHLIRIGRENCLTNVTISLNNKKTDLVALIDTGNSLKEPISQKPVIIAEYNALKTILPELVKNVYLENKDLDLNFIAKIMEEIGDEINLRLIPFKSLGNNNGILIGFVPDSIKVYLDNETKKLKDDIIVAIYNDKLATDEQYNGLLHPEILG
ncbi:sigma-E processing peptidase SpoIIGA, partial [Clostridium sp. Cult2]|uniref:sigma-E processing peptidase SpoIIGA n=1 Tax=Clostridium sp. Cult2 TaxID=2079003 RepID=UPI001F2D57AF